MSEPSGTTTHGAPDTQARAALFEQVEAERERLRTNQMAMGGGMGGVTVWQVMDTAHRAAAIQWPAVHDEWWQLGGLLLAFIIGGGINRLIRGFEL